VLVLRPDVPEDQPVPVVVHATPRTYGSLEGYDVEEETPHVVDTLARHGYALAVVDTGINPYHEFFRAPGLEDPAAWVDGGPEDAEPLDLSLDADSYEEAVDADRDVWDDVQRTEDAGPDGIEDERLYTFPGTRIAAAVSFGEYDPSSRARGRRRSSTRSGTGPGRPAWPPGATSRRPPPTWPSSPSRSARATSRRAPGGRPASPESTP